MVGTSIMVGYVHPHTHLHTQLKKYPIEKVGDFPYSYLYPVNAGISRQNGNEFICHL